MELIISSVILTIALLIAGFAEFVAQSAASSYTVHLDAFSPPPHRKRVGPRAKYLTIDFNPAA
jgi:hypothetical protein